MNMGNALNGATNAAGAASSASNMANAAGNAGASMPNLTNGIASALPGMPNTNGSMPQGENNNGNSPMNNGPKLPSNNNNDDDDDSIEENGEIPENEMNENQQNTGPAPGTKVGAGKEIGKDGEVKDSSTKKLTKAVGQGAAAYFTGGESLGKDQAIKNNGLVDHAVGVVSDVAEKTPGVKQLADELDDAGVIDAATDAMDMIGDIKNGDIAGAIEKGKDVVKDTDKFKKQMVKKLMPIIIASTAGGLLFIVLIMGIVSPIAGGIMDLTEKIGEFFDAVGDFLGDLFGGTNAYDILTDLVEDYDNLSEEQKNIVTVAASALGRNYNWGGHPRGPGIDNFPDTGLDCAGFVQWVLWTAYGSNPGYLTTEAISDLIGTKFVEISESELQPGDIGLKFRGARVGVTNHTGIYAGNGQWIHAAGSKSGVINSKYKNFTIYLRYVGQQ